MEAECNLCKQNRRESIGFSSALCFHTSQEAQAAVRINDALSVPLHSSLSIPPSLLSSILSLCALTTRWVSAPGNNPLYRFSPCRLLSNLLKNILEDSFVFCWAFMCVIASGLETAAQIYTLYIHIFSSKSSVPER